MLWSLTKIFLNIDVYVEWWSGRSASPISSTVIVTEKCNVLIERSRKKYRDGCKKVKIWFPPRLGCQPQILDFFCKYIICFLSFYGCSGFFGFECTLTQVSTITQKLFFENFSSPRTFWKFEKNRQNMVERAILYGGFKE